MNLSLLILLIGFSYVVFVGGMALIRREGLSTRFAVEAAAITILVSGFIFLTNIQINPIIFLIVLYLITMRVRLLVDLASVFARQGRFALADRLFNFAAHLLPDTTSLLVLKVNQATLYLQRNDLDDAIGMYSDVLSNKDQGRLGLKYEAATHYNLGVAYLRKNMDANAAVEFNAVIDIWPGSLYARRAEIALEKRRQKK